MSREVYALMGEQGLPPVMPSQSAAGGFKKKRHGATGQARWEWRAFTNSARNDPSWGVLKLKHWQPASAEQQDYAFALLNKKVSVPTYTPAEYDTRLQVAGCAGRPRRQTISSVRTVPYDIPYPGRH